MDIFGLGEDLSEKQIANIKNHQYKSQGTSVLEPFFQKFWVRLVDYIPCWIAPNVLTLCGLAFNFFAFLPLVISCPTFKEEPPRWALATFAVSFFVYQTLDALDGKHARRIGLSSPMGELFDHGCDAVNTVIVSFVYNISLQLGVEPTINLYSFSIACFLFYLAHWHTYCTGVLHFGIIDVTEAQVVVMLHLLFTAVMGPQVWDREVMVVGQLRVLMIVILTLTCIPAIISHLNVILMEGGCGRAGSTVADSSVLSPVKNILCSIVFMWLIQNRSHHHQSNIAEEYASLYYLLFGFYFIKITSKLVVAHMCKSELSFWDSTMWGPGMVFMNQYMGFLFTEHYVLSIAVLWCVVDWLIYVIRVLLQLSVALNLPVLTVPSEVILKFRSKQNISTSSSFATPYPSFSKNDENRKSSRSSSRNQTTTSNIANTTTTSNRFRTSTRKNSHI